MNQQIISSSLEIMDIAKNGLLKGVDILSSQFPEICNEILRYNFMLSLSTMTMVIIVFLIAIFILITVVFPIAKEEEKKGKANYDGYYAGELTPTQFIRMLMFIVILVFVLILALIPYTDFIKIWIAPKLYLFDYFKDMLN